jgi:hypothetical protein
MEIRKTKPEELNILIRMYENARIFMASHGNPLQWGNTYPAPQILMDDISSGNSYVCVEHDKIIATFYYKEGIMSGSMKGNGSMRLRTESYTGSLPTARSAVLLPSA